MGKKVQVAIRIGKEKLKEYKKWLIDNRYRSINQHLNEVIDKISKESEDEQARKRDED